MSNQASRRQIALGGKPPDSSQKRAPIRPTYVPGSGHSHGAKMMRHQVGHPSKRVTEWMSHLSNKPDQSDHQSAV